MSNPRVSVCIVTFNHEKYIHDCVMSVIAQSADAELEILVGDDVSEDGTQSIMEALAHRYPDIIRYYRNPSRLGPAANYLSIIQRARGQYIAHLDGDDFWLPGKLAAQIRHLDQYPDCPAVYTNAFAIDDGGAGIGMFNNTLPGRFNIDELLVRGNFLCHSSMLYRSSGKEAVLAIPAPFIDYRIHLRHARQGAIGYINRALVVYRVNSASSILVHANDAVRELYWEALLSLPPGSAPPGIVAKSMAEFGRSVFFRSIQTRNTALLRKWLRQVINHSPVGKPKMIVLLIGSIVRVGLQELAQALRSRISGTPFRILYRR